MDKEEAFQILQRQLEPWRRRSYAELARQIDQASRFEIVGESGIWYQGDVRAFWDGKPGGAIRVIAAIDAGGWRAYFPLTDDFILGPDGTFIDEQ